MRSLLNTNECLETYNLVRKHLWFIINFLRFVTLKTTCLLVNILPQILI